MILIESVEAVTRIVIWCHEDAHENFSVDLETETVQTLACGLP